MSSHIDDAITYVTNEEWEVGRLYISSLEILLYTVHLSMFEIIKLPY